MADQFDPIEAVPYAWPFDGRWSSADSAVLLLGFQAGLIDALGAREELDRACALARAAKAAGLAVLASQREAGAPSHAPVEASVPQGPVADCVLAVAEAELVVHKGDNIFFNSNIDVAKMLQGRGVRNLIFAGLPTDGLLHASMRAANDKGFECLAVSDACKGTSSARHEAQLRITTFGNGLFGAVAPVRPLLEAFGRKS